MLIGIMLSAFWSGKLSNGLHGLICRSWGVEHDSINPLHKSIFEWTLWGFYFSKYWEWLDTAFLILSAKDVSWLQYTHHMSTAFLTYINITPFFSSLAIVTVAANTFVHTFMYWYFAFSRGVLARYRMAIMFGQTLQHVMVLSTLVYIILLHRVSAK